MRCTTKKTVSAQTACPCPPATPLQVLSPTTGQIKTPFQLSVEAGVFPGPTVGLNSYQNDVLIDALDVNIIFVNDTPEKLLLDQYTFDPTTGTLLRFQGDGVTPNLWEAGDVLVINYSKLV